MGCTVMNIGFRVEKAKKFVKAITRPTRSDLAPVRVKQPVRFEQVETIFPRFLFCSMFTLIAPIKLSAK